MLSLLKVQIAPKDIKNPIDILSLSADVYDIL